MCSPRRGPRTASLRLVLRRWVRERPPSRAGFDHPLALRAGWSGLLVGDWGRGVLTGSAKGKPCSGTPKRCRTLGENLAVLAGSVAPDDGRALCYVRARYDRRNGRAWRAGANLGDYALELTTADRCSLRPKVFADVARRHRPGGVARLATGRPESTSRPPLDGDGISNALARVHFRPVRVERMDLRLFVPLRLVF